MSELLPCPFCGGAATLEEPGADGAQRVVCRNIRCFGPATSPVVYPADAIAMWNLRPSPSISEGEVEAAARAIKAKVPYGYGMTEGEAVEYARAALSVVALPQDMIDLVIEARNVAYSDQSADAINALDKAVEAFAERVGWDDDPAALVGGE